MVYVINHDNTPLMPCTPVVARLLLKQNKARCLRRTPFTIKLLKQTTNHVQPITLGIDTGSSVIGSAAVTDTGVVLYLAETTVRNDITDKMKQRSKYRRTRRTRKTRYRPARWRNRKNSIREDRFSPTVTSKINSHLKEIKFVTSILPVSKLFIETASFDVHALKNPEVLKNSLLYQHGLNYGFANTKAYVLDRDKHTYQHCKGKEKDNRLHAHHIVFRRNGGSDEADNLIILCKTCHDALHNGLLKLKKSGKKKGQLRHATQMNSIRKQLLKALPLAIETFGFITKENRQLLNLPKEHYVDAIVIASQGNPVTLKTNTLFTKRCIAMGDYQQTKGIRSEKRIPTGKIQGFKKLDTVCYQGTTYLIKGRMSTGYAVLMTIDGTKVPLKPIPKFTKLTRVRARKSWLIDQKTIQNIA